MKYLPQAVLIWRPTWAVRRQKIDAALIFVWVPYSTKPVDVPKPRNGAEAARMEAAAREQTGLPGKRPNTATTYYSVSNYFENFPKVHFSIREASQDASPKV